MIPELSTSYLGLTLRNPLIASSGPLTEDLENVHRLVEAGVAAIVLPSLFEEQIEIEALGLDRVLSFGGGYAESLDYFPDLGHYRLGPASYLEHLRACKRAVKVPVIASLNGSSPGGWTEFAAEMEAAGADALEINIYLIPTDPELSAAAVEDHVLEAVRAVRAAVRVPLAVKLGPYYSALAHLARRLADAGADALVLFNRFYQPDLDLESLEVVPRLALSQPHELLLRVHWCALLYGRVPCDLAVTGGVHAAADVFKAMMAGAAAATITSAFLLHGPEHAAALLRDMRQWMIEHDYASIAQMRGSMSYRNVPDPSAFERANYMRVLKSYVPGRPFPGP